MKTIIKTFLSVFLLTTFTSCSFNRTQEEILETIGDLPSYSTIDKENLLIFLTDSTWIYIDNDDNTQKIIDCGTYTISVDNREIELVSLKFTSDSNNKTYSIYGIITPENSYETNWSNNITFTQNNKKIILYNNQILYSNDSIIP